MEATAPRSNYCNALAERLNDPIFDTGRDPENTGIRRVEGWIVDYNAGVPYPFFFDVTASAILDCVWEFHSKCMLDTTNDRHWMILHRWPSFVIITCSKVSFNWYEYIHHAEEGHFNTAWQEAKKKFDMHALISEGERPLPELAAALIEQYFDHQIKGSANQKDRKIERQYQKDLLAKMLVTALNYDISIYIKHLTDP